MVYGYCRISTNMQNIERQIKNIKDYNNEAVIIEETFSGTKMKRPQWEKLLKKLKKGDTVIFDEVSRMSRNAEEGIKVYFELMDKGITLIFLKEAYINTDLYNENMKDRIELTGNDEDEILIGLNNYFRRLAERQIRIAFEQAEKEVKYLQQRTKEGLAIAKLNGKRIGLPKGSKLVTKKSVEMKEKIKKYNMNFGGTLNNADCIKLLKITPNTFYKYKKELMEEKQNEK